MEGVYDLISKNAKELDTSRLLLLTLATFSSILENSENYRKLSEELPGPLEELEGVVVSGMGGSFISGLFLQDMISDRSPKPLILNRDSKLPRFVDKRYLLVAVSYSGNTEETLRVYLEGVRRGIPIVAITSGGELEDVSRRVGVPVVSVPKGMPPRAAFPHLTLALAAVILRVIGIDLISELKQASERLKDRLSVQVRNGVELARRLFEGVKEGRVPLIYGYSPYLSPGYRFKTQLNENAKVHAFFGELPEANHNEIMGWSGPLGKFTVVLLRGREEPPHMRARLEFLERLMETKNVPMFSLRGEAGDRTCELLSMVFKVDVASIALALLLGVDPTPVGTITELKMYLEERVGFSLRDEITGTNNSFL